MDNELVEKIDQDYYWENTKANNLEQFDTRDRDVIDENLADDIIVNYLQTGVARIGTPPDVVSIKKNRDNYFLVYVQSKGLYYKCDTYEGLGAFLSGDYLQ